jgi:hypothetical protein
VVAVALDEPHALPAVNRERIKPHIMPLRESERERESVGALPGD